jgi:hypothetical protein
MTLNDRNYFRKNQEENPFSQFPSAYSGMPPLNYTSDLAGSDPMMGTVLEDLRRRNESRGSGMIEQTRDINNMGLGAGANLQSAEAQMAGQQMMSQLQFMNQPESFATRPDVPAQGNEDFFNSANKIKARLNNYKFMSNCSDGSCGY